MRRAKMGRIRISFTHTCVISVLQFLFRGIKNSIYKRERIFFTEQSLPFASFVFNVNFYVSTIL